MMEDWAPLLGILPFLAPNTHQENWCLEFLKSKWCYEDSRHLTQQLDIPICITALGRLILRLNTRRDFNIVLHVRQLPLRISDVTNREVTDWHFVNSPDFDCFRSASLARSVVFRFSNANQTCGKHLGSSGQFGFWIRWLNNSTTISNTNTACRSWIIFEFNHLWIVAVLCKILASINIPWAEFRSTSHRSVIDRSKATLLFLYYSIFCCVLGRLPDDWSPVRFENIFVARSDF